MIERRPYGYWKEWGNLQRELEVIIERLGHFPSLTELSNLGLSKISSAISKYHGGFSLVRAKMSYKQIRKPNDYWRDWENAKGELNLVIEQLGHFPTNTDLRISGNSSLNRAIWKYHGGINRTRMRFGYNPTRKSKGYLQDWDNVKNEFEEVIRKIGHFPTEKELTHMGKSSIAQATRRYYGGFGSVRERLGYNSRRNPRNYWKDWKNVENELELMIRRLGHFPTRRDFRESKADILRLVIGKYHGGLRVVKEKMGYSSNTQELESLLENYIGERK